MYKIIVFLEILLKNEELIGKFNNSSQVWHKIYHIIRMTCTVCRVKLNAVNIVEHNMSYPVAFVRQ